MSKSAVTKSSGNVFADAGLPDAGEYMAKARVAMGIVKIIRKRRLSQSAAAKLLGVDQPKVSALMRGRLDGFSAERLFRFLNSLGSDVEIVIGPARGGARRASVRVSAAPKI